MNEAQAKPEIIVPLDRPRRACLDLNAMCAIEEKIGKSFFQGVKVGPDMGMKDLRLILWGSLLSDDPTLTLEQLNDLVTPKMLLSDLQPQIVQLLNAAFPSSEPAEGEEKKGE